MRLTRIPLVLGVVFATAVVGSIVLFTTSGTKPAAAATVQNLLSSQGTAPWSERDLTGTTVLTGQVPVAVANKTAGYVGPHSAKTELRLNFGFPLRDQAKLDALIKHEAKTHQFLTHERSTRSSRRRGADRTRPSRWLQANGFRITHLSRDRLSVAASATTRDDRAGAARADQRLRAPRLDHRRHEREGVRVLREHLDPLVPARLGLQTISGMTNVDRFFTPVQLSKAAHGAGTCDGNDGGPVNPLCVDVRSGGYFPSDLQSLYDVTGHGFDGTGQTVGFTLWTAAERQPAMTAFAADDRRPADHGRSLVHRRPATRPRRRARASRRRSPATT